MRPFDLEKALAGSKIIDECGHIGEYKFTNLYNGIKTHLFQFAVNDNEDQAIISYKEGRGWLHGLGSRAYEFEANICMAPVKRQEWVNIHYVLDKGCPNGQYYVVDDHTFKSEQDAIKFVEENGLANYMKSVLIREWEE